MNVKCYFNMLRFCSNLELNIKMIDYTECVEFNLFLSLFLSLSPFFFIIHFQLIYFIFLGKKKKISMTSFRKEKNCIFETIYLNNNLTTYNNQFTINLHIT